jgi:hypothetical protein
MVALWALLSASTCLPVVDDDDTAVTPDDDDAGDDDSTVDDDDSGPDDDDVDDDDSTVDDDDSASPVCLGDYEVTGSDAASEMAAIAGCEVIEGDLNISSTALTDIDGLSNLTMVGGSLTLSTNTVLTNLDGLSSARS